MPVFDFKCAYCNETKNDVVMKINATSEQFPTCPNCGELMGKVPSRFSAHFVGAGFHRNDYNAPTRG